MGFMYYIKVGDYPRAQNYYEKALADFEAGEADFQKSLHPTAPVIVGQSAQDRAKGERDWEAQEASNSEMRFAGHVVQHGMILSNLGDVALEAGDFKGATVYYARASQLEALLEGGNGLFTLMRTVLHGRNSKDMAYLHAVIGELDLADDEAAQAVASYRALGKDEATGGALLLQASIREESGHAQNAIPLMRQVLQFVVAEQNINRMIAALGELSFLSAEAGNFDEAARYASQALPLARASGNFGNIGMSARDRAAARIKQKQFAEVEPLLREAQAAQARTGSVRNRINILSLRGQLLEAQGQNDAALEQLKQAVTLTEGLREASGSEAYEKAKSNVKIYDHIVRLLLKMNRPENAFEYLQRARSKELRDTLRVGTVKTPNPALQTLLDHFNETGAQLRTAETNYLSEKAKPAEAEQQDPTKLATYAGIVAQKQEEYFKLARSIKQHNASLSATTDFNETQLQQARASLPADVVLVQYVPAEEEGRLYIMLATRDSIKVAQVPVKPSDLWAHVKEFRTLMNAAKRQVEGGEALPDMNAPDSKPLRDNLEWLYATLITPVAPELQKRHTVVFWPTQLLFYLPMGALAHEDNGQLHFLAEQKAIAYLSGDTLVGVLAPHDATQTGRGLTAFGNPIGADLPGALQETQSIAQMFAGATILTGDAATKKAAEGDEVTARRILHFATHGHLVPDDLIEQGKDDSNQSYIQLAKGAAPSDAQLSFDDIHGLTLDKVDLVMLSACETAVGEHNPGKEIMTHAGAFAGAGAGSVTASLWSVSDDSTRDQMVAFYTALSKGQSKADALQAAQLTVMHNPKYRHPFYWAPFILMGDWR